MAFVDCWLKQEASMIFGIEAGLFIAGLMALIRGKLTLTPTKVVEGRAARLLGLVLMAPVPLILSAAYVWAAASNAGDADKFRESFVESIRAVELPTIIVCGVIPYAVGSRLSRPPDPPAIKRKPTPSLLPDDVDV
jgi:hypothetical protein